MRATPLAGYSLIDILISLAFASFLSLGLVSLYCLVNSNSDQQYQQMVAADNAVQANALFHTLLLQAGYLGCSSPRNLSIYDAIREKEVVFPALRILRHEDAPTDLQQAMLPSSQAIQIYFMDNKTAILLHENGSANILLASLAFKFKAGDLALISNCEKAELFQIEQVFPEEKYQMIKTRQAISEYPAGALLGIWHQPVLYVAYSGRYTRKKQAIPSLFIQEKDKKDEELIEGVSQLKVKQEINEVMQKITIEFSTLALAEEAAVNKFELGKGEKNWELDFYEEK